jgi:hypothetical protein
MGKNGRDGALLRFGREVSRVFWFENHKEGVCVEDLGVDVSMLLNWVLQGEGVMVWTGLTSLRMQVVCKYGNDILDLIKWGKISRPSEYYLVSKVFESWRYFYMAVLVRYIYINLKQGCFTIIFGVFRDKLWILFSRMITSLWFSSNIQILHCD